MSKVVEVSLRIFGRDLTIACPPKEKNNLIKAANLLNDELENMFIFFRNTLTMLSKAPKYQLNHSNNPTYLKNTGTNIGLVASSSYEYVETPRQVANVVSSSFTDVAPDFAKETYISKVGIYDENKNLIGVAKLATPIRKTDEREFLIKLRLDI